LRGAIPGVRAAALVALALLCLVVPGRAAGQATRADSAAVILETARRFESGGRGDVATALYEYLLERFGDTAAAVEARRMLAVAPAGRSGRGGRVELQVWSTLYGLWLGVAVPAALGADGPEPYGVGLLLGGPLGFLTGAGLARSREFSDGQARAITFGGTWGTWQGYGWADVSDWGEIDYDSCDPLTGCSGENRSTERRFAGMVAGGLAGIAAGVALSRRDIPAGVATTVNFGALWGTWFGLAGGILLDAEDDNLLMATLLGGDAGLVGTALLAPRWNLSRNRARLISIAGVIGGLGGAGIDLIVQPEDKETAVAIPLATSVAGLLIGTLTTRNYDARAIPGGGAGEALLELRDGRLSLGSPMPAPVLVPIERSGRRSRELAAGLTLFHARFQEP